MLPAWLKIAAYYITFHAYFLVFCKNHTMQHDVCKIYEEGLSTINFSLVWHQNTYYQIE